MRQPDFNVLGNIVVGKWNHRFQHLETLAFGRVLLATAGLYIVLSENLKYQLMQEVLNLHFECTKFNHIPFWLTFFFTMQIPAITSIFMGLIYINEYGILNGFQFWHLTLLTLNLGQLSNFCALVPEDYINTNITGLL